MKKNKDSKGSQTQEDSNQDSNNNSTTDNSNQEFENESNWSESVNDLDTDSGFKDETDSLESKSDTEGDDIDKDAHALNPNLAENCEKVCCKYLQQKYNECFKEIDKFQAGNSSDEKSSRANKDDKDSDNNLVILDEGLDLTNGEDDDSSDYDSSSDEDDVVEFMPDGEVMRKKSRGFKQLNNCKRFWKASLYQ